MRSIAMGVLVAASIVGCSGPTRPEPRLFRTALPQEVDQPLPVVLGDETGLVTGIGPAADPQGDGVQPVVLADPSDPKAFVITWLGGPCERDAALSFKSKEGGYLLQLAVSQNTGGCLLIGNPRGVRIVTSAAIHVSSIEVTGRG
jgi:hypothetical protein